MWVHVELFISSSSVIIPPDKMFYTGQNHFALVIKVISGGQACILTS